MSVYNKVIDLQKLSAAWQRVRRNKPAAGADNITWQQFDWLMSGLDIEQPKAIRSRIA